MTEGTKIDKYDIGVGHLGNGLTVWDRNREKNGDYMTIAHIGETGKITWRDKKLTPKVKKFIEEKSKELIKMNIGESMKSTRDLYKVIDIKTGDIIDEGLPKKIAQKLSTKKQDWISYPDNKNIGESMKLKDAMQFEITEDIFASLTDPDSGLDEEQKKTFLEAVSGFNRFNESIYREQVLSDITHDIVKIGKLAEIYIMAEQEDWFDGISVKRDMKSLQDSIKMFEVTAKEVSVLKQRLESVYEEVGGKLGKYFDISDDLVKEEEVITLSDIIKKDLKK